MFLLEYALKHISRRAGKALGMLALPAILTLFLCCLNGLVDMLNDRSEHLTDSLTVTAVLSDITGSNQSNLWLDELDIAHLTDEGHLQGYVGELSVAREVYYSLDKEGSSRYPLVGVSDLKGSYSNFLLSTEVEVSFAEGWNKSALQGDAQVCVIPEGLLLQGYSPGDVLELRVSDSEWEAPFATLSLTVIGSFRHNVDGLLFCPWQTLKTLLNTHERPSHAQALSFTLKDNRTLDEFREKAAMCYKEIDYMAARQAHEYALTVHDESLRDSVASMERSIRTVQIIIPVVLALSALIGFLAGLLQVYNRRRELHLLRLQGVTRRDLIFIIASEALMLTFVGLLTGLIISPLIASILSLSGNEIASVGLSIRDGITLLLGVNAGYILATLLLTRKPLLQSVKEVA